MCCVILSRCHLTYSVSTHQFDGHIISSMHFQLRLVFLHFFFHFLYLALKVLPSLLLLTKLFIDIPILLRKLTRFGRWVNRANSLNRRRRHRICILLPIGVSLLQVIEKLALGITYISNLILIIDLLNFGIHQLILDFLQFIGGIMSFIFLQGVHATD